MTASKQRVLVYGNCQGGWLTNALRENKEIAGRFEIVYLSDYTERPIDHPIHQPDFLRSCSIVVWQTASGCKPPAFLEGLSAGCRQIRYPTLWLKLLWPTYAVDPRNQPEAGFPWGRYPYGDRLVMKLLAEGVTLDDLPKRYVDTDLNKIINLERFREMSLAELRFNDQQSDLAITPFIESTFRQRKLFGTVNHPTFLILDRIYRGVEAALLERAIPTETPPPVNAADVLGEEETPLHPQIIEHYKLEWAFPGMRWRYRSAFLTLEEYLRAYGAFTPIPMGAPPQLWLARAQQAAGHHNLAEAQRLLLDGATLFPAAVEFLQYLGMLLVRHDRLEEAEKVFRYAISRHPSVAALHYELGGLMARQDFPEQAAREFQEALSLDPGHKAARHQLIVAAGRRTGERVATGR